MIRRLIRLCWTTALVASLAIGIAPSLARATDANDVVDQGWWNRSNDDSVPVTVPPPPNVDDDDLYVAGAPDGAAAVAALKLELADDQTNPVLTMTVDDGQGIADAVILACQTGSGWTGEHNGVWQSKPLADCSSGSVVGIVADDALSVTFPLGPLQFSDKINVVLVAGADPDLPDGAERFDVLGGLRRADATSIQTTAGAQQPVSPSAPPAAPVTDGAGNTFQPAPSPGAFDAGGTHASPPAPVAPALPETDQGQSATAPVLQESTLGNTSLPEPITLSRDGRPFAILLLVAAAGGAVWDFKRRSDSPADAEAPGGLGRFVRPRTGTPPSLT